MHKRHLIWLVAIVALSATAGHHEEEAPLVSADEQALAEAMMKAATPGEPHKMLAKSVGEYDAEMMFYMAPDAPPMESKMTVVRTMELDGRVLHEVWSGMVMGAPFKGVGRTGYDNVTGKYWSTWNDNMSTGLLLMRGDWDEDQAAIVMTGESAHPVTGETYTSRSVGTFPSEGVEVMTMYEDHGDGEYKSMTFRLVRK